MAPNLRLSLSIFTIGFLIEAGEDVYSLMFHASKQLAGETLFVVGVVATVVGMIFLTIGRHEWNELHRTRVGHAHATFLTVVLLGAAAAGPLAYYGYNPSVTIPSWISYEAGAAIAASLFFSFILYAVIVYHLLSPGGRATLAVALAAAVPVAGVVGFFVARDIPTYLATVRASPTKLTTLVEPVVSYLSYMFLAYALFAVAFMDAHRRVAQGLGSAPMAARSAASGPSPPHRDQ